MSSNLIPDLTEVKFAREALQKLEALSAGSGIALSMGGGVVQLSEGVSRLLRETLKDVAEGKAVAVVPLEEEFTPNEAADLLNVSRGYVMKLVEAGELPSRKVGSHHRLPLAGLLEYKERWRSSRRAAVNGLIAEAQELGMGY